MTARRSAAGGRAARPDRLSAGERAAPPGLASSLRSAFRAEARRLSTRSSTGRALGAIALHIGAGIAAALAAERARAAGSAWTVVALPLAWFFIGSRLRALGNMMHECSHRILTGDGRVDDRLGHFLGFFDFTDFRAYRLDHGTHHRHLGHPTLDRDYAPRRRLFERMGPFGLRHVLLPLTLFHLPLYVRPVLWSRQDTRLEAAARLGFHAGIAALGVFVTGWWPLLLYYAIPYLTTYQVMRFWSDAADHAGLMTSPTEFERSRNHCFRLAALNWLILPRNDQYHLVHHVFPAVPTRNLPALHALLLRDGGYRARLHGVELLR